MAHYIDKSTVMAEIEKRLNYRNKELDAINNGTFWDEEQSEDTFNVSLTKCAYNAVKNELFELKCFLDIVETIEVKEVDLDESARYYLLHEHISPLNEVLHQADLKVEMQYHKDIEDAYKAGFELGLKAQTDAFIQKAKEAFCKATCNGHPPRSTCTSLGTCKEHDNFVKFMKEE